MALVTNPDTGLIYDTENPNAPGVSRFAIKKVSTNAVINTNAKWLRNDGAQGEGVSADLAYYLKVDEAAPDADHRFKILSEWQLFPYSPAQDPADGLPVGEYKPVHTLTPLEIEDLNLQIENQFQVELRKAFPSIEDPALLVEAADAITRKQNGVVLSTEQEDRLTRVLGLGTAVAQLRTRQAELIAAAEAFAADPESEAGIYDIEAGWSLI